VRLPGGAHAQRYTGLSERTVRGCLGRLEADSLIRPCDPAVVAARIKRADRRPKGWDLDLSRIRDDLTENEITALERQFPGLTSRLATLQCDDVGPASGVRSPHPVPDPVDKGASGVQRPHRAAGTGCNERAHRVQSVLARGAVVAPEPYEEPSREPSAAPSHAREASYLGVAGGGAPMSEFFAALGDGWRLTAAQRARLAPAVTAALRAGWTPRALAAFTGANTDGVRNLYAVLGARLSDAELPSPPMRSSRPPWCGQCDERTRRREDADGADTGRCPACHPLADQPGPGRRTPRPAGSNPRPQALPSACGSDGVPMPSLRLAKARHGPGRRDSVRPSAYHGTRAGLLEGVRRRG
jgi:hypothetical protein